MYVFHTLREYDCESVREFMCVRCAYEIVMRVFMCMWVCFRVCVCGCCVNERVRV